MPGHLQTTLLVVYRGGRNLSQMLTNKRLPPSDSTDSLYSTINNDTPNPLRNHLQYLAGRFTPTETSKSTFHTHTRIKRKLNVPAPDSGPVGLTADALAAKLMENSHEQLRALLREKHLYL